MKPNTFKFISITENQMFLSQEYKTKIADYCHDWKLNTEEFRFFDNYNRYIPALSSNFPNPLSVDLTEKFLENLFNFNNIIYITVTGEKGTYKSMFSRSLGLMINDFYTRNKIKINEFTINNITNDNLDLKNKITAKIEKEDKLIKENKSYVVPYDVFVRDEEDFKYGLESDYYLNELDRILQRQRINKNYIILVTPQKSSEDNFNIMLETKYTLKVVGYNTDKNIFIVLIKENGVDMDFSGLCFLKNFKNEKLYNDYVIYVKQNKLKDLSMSLTTSNEFDYYNGVYLIDKEYDLFTDIQYKEKDGLDVPVFVPKTEFGLYMQMIGLQKTGEGAGRLYSLYKLIITKPKIKEKYELFVKERQKNETLNLNENVNINNVNNQ